MSWEVSTEQEEPSGVWYTSFNRWGASREDASQRWSSQTWFSGDTASSASDGWREAWESEEAGRRVRARYEHPTDASYGQTPRTPGSITDLAGGRAANRPRGKDPTTKWNTGLHSALREGGKEAAERYKQENPKPTWWDKAIYAFERAILGQDAQKAEEAREGLRNFYLFYPTRPEF